MTRPSPLCRIPSALLGAACVLWQPAATAAFDVYKIGGPDGNAWGAPISFEPGTSRIFDVEGAVVGTRSLSTIRTFATWGDTLTEVVDSLGGLWLQPFYIPDTLNLAQDGVRERIGRGISNNIITSGTCYNNISQVTKARPMFDGDPTTAAFYTASASDDPSIRRGFYIQNTIVDLGLNYPVNRIRFFPRIGSENVKFDEILESLDEPKLDPEALLTEDFSGNFLPWFELAGAEAVHNFAANCYWRTSTSPFFRRIQYISNPEPDSRWDILAHETESLDIVVDVRFPTQLFQWITFRPLNPIRNWEVAEFQVFGEGFVPRAVYTTSVLDLGESMALGRIRLQGARDPEGRLLLRTRTGSDPDPNLYWEPSTIPGEPQLISREEWERANITERQVTLDQENWSFWSSPYDWDEAQVDPGADPAAWTDGTPIRSPGPARYLQVQMVFLSKTNDAARLREIEIQFSRPAASLVLGEVWPIDAERLGSTPFTYSVLPDFGTEEQGFDRLEIFTLTRADTVRAVRVDGGEIDILGEFRPQIEEDRILLSLPELRGPGDAFKLIEVEFDTRVVRYGTEFTGWVFDSGSTGVRQQIEAGEANVAFPGNALGVRTGEVGAELITRVVAAPNPFTPNGDGVNDEVFFRFQVHELSDPRVLEVSLHDLSGRLVRRLSDDAIVRGIYGEAGVLGWNGRDENEAGVPAGIYLYRILLETDSGEEQRLGTIAVAY